MAFKQNLQGAAGTTLTGAHGGTQQLGEAAQRRLAQQASPPAPEPAWKQLAAAGMAGQGSAAANRAAAGNLPAPSPPIMDTAQTPRGVRSMPGGPGASEPISLPGFQPAPGLQVMDGGPGMFVPPQGPEGGGPNVFHGLNPAGGGMQGGAPDMIDLPGRPAVFGTPGQGVQQPGEGGPDQMQHPGGPLPGFTAAPGMMHGPLGSMPGAQNKFPPRPGLPTKPLPIPQTRPPGGGGPGYPGPRNNMQGF